jgi:DNA processing protein
MSLFVSDSNYPQELLLAYLQDKINLTPARLDQILSLYPDLQTALNDNFEELKVLKPKWLLRYKPEDPTIKINQLQELLTNNQIQIVTHQESDYPQSLKILNNFPLVVYFQGTLQNISNNLMLTVVGSRQIDTYSQTILPSILGSVCRSGVGVISGLAIGIDTLAHRTALDNNSFTIGVIGSGHCKEVFYPIQNWSMVQQIVQTGGCVLSEYSPMTSPNVYTFPQRNRILAALSDLTWVVQAAKDSGSLITSVQARELGKTVATTPADIRNANFAGNLQLLKQGASIITESQDVFDLLGLKTHPEINSQVTIQFGSQEEEKIYNQLTILPQTIEIVATKCNLNSTQISTSLSLLELNGLAICLGQNEWVKVVV